MTGEPMGETNWLSLSGKELKVLAVGVGVALLALGISQGARSLWGRRAVTVHRETGDAARPLRLNVNTAAEYELVMLPGIGSVTAGAIVRDREQNGPFRSLNDLQRVKGIGPKTVERIRPHAMCATDNSN